MTDRRFVDVALGLCRLGLRDQLRQRRRELAHLPQGFRLPAELSKVDPVLRKRQHTLVVEGEDGQIRQPGRRLRRGGISDAVDLREQAFQQVRDRGIRKVRHLGLLLAYLLVALNLLGSNGTKAKQGKGERRSGDEQAEDPPPSPPRARRRSVGAHRLVLSPNIVQYKAAEGLRFCKDFVKPARASDFHLNATAALRHPSWMSPLSERRKARSACFSASVRPSGRNSRSRNGLALPPWL